MKTLKKFLLPLVMGAVLMFGNCREDDSMNYKRLEELNKIYIQMYDAQADAEYFSKIQSGGSDEAYNLIYNKLVKEADSIKELLPKRFKEKADSLYEEVFYE